MLELWFVVSTVCFSSYSDYHEKIEKHLGNQSTVVLTPQCVQQVSVSTFQPTPKEGETIYRTIKQDESKSLDQILDKLEIKLNKIKEEYRKDVEPYYPHLHPIDFQYPETLEWEKCCCGKRRRKLESWKWIEE